MAACSGRRRGQRRFKRFVFVCFDNPHHCFKVRDKWNQLVFVPMPVLNNRDLLSGGKAGKREGFNVFNR